MVLSSFFILIILFDGERILLCRWIVVVAAILGWVCGRGCGLCLRFGMFLGLVIGYWLGLLCMFSFSVFSGHVRACGFWGLCGVLGLFLLMRSVELCIVFILIFSQLGRS